MKKNNEEIPNGLREEQIAEFYANGVFLNISKHEFEFGHRLVDTSGRLKGAVNIRMSPPVAKEFAELLNVQLAEYEKKIGEIP